jgi:Putative peptidoglycan binding domain
MTTYTPTLDEHRDHYREVRDTPLRTSSRRRKSTRAFALGAAIASLCIGGAWAAVETSHSHPGSNPASTPAAAGTATTGTGTQTGSTTGPSGGAASGSHGLTPANTYPHGQDVSTLQRDLGLLNYYENPVDGVYGPATTAAIKDFQRANGLAVDGIAGPSTMAKIKQQLVTGDSQMNPGPLVKPTDNTSTPANGTKTNGEAANATGGAAAGSSSGGGAATN